jgi:MoxR-like ATPase
MTDRRGGPGLVPGPEALAGEVVGRTREIELLLAGLDCGAHVVLEGPPGTGKTTLLRAIAGTSGVPFVFVEGNAELTPARLLGHFDPAQVLAKGYVPETFVDGPLIEALRAGGLLYVEEVNRVPEETLNVLITVMSEGELHVPRLGRVRAADTFRLVAAMNPFDTVGTARISAAIYDRVCRIVMGYQAREEENDIVARRSPYVPEPWRDQVVDLVRRTRGHPDVRVGSSVRGAIDLVRIAVSLARIRGGEPTAWQTGYDAAMVALSGRIGMRESSGRTAESVIEDLYAAVFGARPESASGDGAGGGAPGESRARSGRAPSRRGRAPPRPGEASRAPTSRATAGSPRSLPRSGCWTRTGSTACSATIRTWP